MSITPVSQVKRNILDVAQVLISKKGFSAVGLSEVLQAAKVPKGSFYHYFGSKDAFGVALLEAYFEAYLGEMAGIFQRSGLTESEKLNLYFRKWIENQTGQTESGRCLAVKLGAEVADLSEPMRLALQHGTARIIECLASAISRGILETSLKPTDSPERTALQFYSLWLGASVMAKITDDSGPFEDAISLTNEALLQPD